MQEKVVSEPSFVSCIKVKGIDLLPPVITPKLRTQLEKDRLQAIKLEKHLQNTKELKQNLKKLLTLKTISLERPESAITFGDDSHIDDLGISSARSTVQLKKKEKRINLSKDMAVSEYNDGIKIIDKLYCTTDFLQGQSYSVSQAYDTDTSCRTDVSSSKTCKIGSSSIVSKSSKEGSVERNLATDLLVGHRQAKTPPKARLIRSNSYTLESPSPMLLAHLEKCFKGKDFDNEQTEEPLSLSRTWTSLENNYVPFEQSQFSSLNTVYNFSDKLEDKEEYEDNETDEITWPEKDKHTTVITPATPPTIEDLSPRIEVIQTDISLQQITVNSNSDQVEPIKTTLDLTDPDCQLMQVLEKIPADYSKKIIELIEKQRIKHSNKVENFGKQFSNARNLQCSTPVPDDDRSSISAISASPSQSIYYSFCSSDTLVPNSPSVKVTDLADNYDEGSIISFINETDDKYIYENVEEDGLKESGKTFNNNYRSVDSVKKEWAACLIGAYIKGYLTRRLLRTERVQSIISTIKDALICALELHTIEHIEEADIELHRRLINQVSAACLAFHDIFFALSISEKMTIISADRQQKIEKLLRPKSASIMRSVSNSSRSSTRSVSPLPQSVTKI